MHNLHGKTISFVIPFLNEEKNILQNLPHYAFLRDLLVGDIRCEVVFVDGGSIDDSRQLLIENGFDVISSKKGRSQQLNAGAKFSNGDVLVFLHADTVIPKNIDALFVSMIKAKWGFFRLALSNPGWAYHIVSSGINIRSKLFKQATGDQVIFFDRSVFFSMDGFLDIPLMEDIEITRRASKLYQPYIIEDKVISSSRRWEKNGVIKTVVFMWFIQLCYVFGVSIDTLARWYYPEDTTDNST